DCFAALERRAEEALPDCRQDIRWLEELPFIGRPAALDREEIDARQAAMAYLAAAVGAPDRANRREGFAQLAAARRPLDAGSRQPAPEPELYATLVGDRDALRARADRLTRPHAQKDALAAALLEDGTEAAAALAARFLDAGDDEVRLWSAALRCAVGDPAGM